MDIKEHIPPLLYTESCVVVPGLGAFVTSARPAEYDKRRGMLLPPRKEVVFNPNLTLNDGTLLNAISQKTGVAYAQVLMEAESQIAGMKACLRLGQTVSFEGVGTLSYAAETGVYMFVADDRQNFSPDSYGFEPVSVTEIERRPNTLRVTGKTIWKAAGWAAAVGLLLMISSPLNDVPNTAANPTNYASMITPLQPDQTEPYAPNEATKPTDGETGDRPNASGDERATTARSEVETPDTPAKPSGTQAEKPSEKATDNAGGNNKGKTAKTAQTGKYHIIVGSYATEAEADQVIANFAKRGINNITKLPTPDGKRVRLSAGSFADKAQAQRKNKAMRKQKGFEKAWVLTLD